MADLGTLKVTLVANLRKFVAGMMTATKAVKTFGSRVGKTMLKAGAMIRAFASRSLGFLKKFASKMIRFFRIAIPAAMALSIRELAKFQEQMAFVNTMLDDQTEHLLPGYTRAIKDMAVEFGEGTAALTRGLFDILSASIDASKAIEVLRASVKAAKAGMTDTAVAADVITTLIKAYGLEADQASNVSDILFATVKKGKTTFAELAPNIGKVASIAAVAKVNMADMGAAIATMTRAGLRTEIAITSLRAITLAFLKPMDDSVKMAKKFGIELNSNTLKAGGLTRVMKKLKTATAEELAVIIPSARAIAGFASMIQQAGKMAEDYDFILNSLGKTQEAYEKQTASLMFKLKRLWAITRILAVEFGHVLAPVVESFINWVIPRQEDWRKSLQNFSDFAKNDFGAGIKIGLDIVKEIFVGFGKAIFVIMKHAVLGLLSDVIWDPLTVGVTAYFASLKKRIALTLEHPIAALFDEKHIAFIVKEGERAGKAVGDLEKRILRLERAENKAASSAKTLAEELREVGDATTKAISDITDSIPPPEENPLFPDQGDPGAIGDSLNEAATLIGNATTQMEQDLRDTIPVVEEVTNTWQRMWTDTAFTIERVIQGATDGVTNAFVNGLETMAVEMDNFGEIAKKMLVDIMQEIARMQARLVAAKILGSQETDGAGLGDLIGNTLKVLAGGGGGAPATGMPTGNPAFLSGGGIVQPVYAANGFTARGTDTVPAMLTPGEMVIPKEIVDMMGDRGPAVTIQVQTVDTQSFAQWLNKNKRLLAGAIGDTNRGNNPASRRLGGVR